MTASIDYTGTLDIRSPLVLAFDPQYRGHNEVRQRQVAGTPLIAVCPLSNASGLIFFWLGLLQTQKLDSGVSVATRSRNLFSRLVARIAMLFEPRTSLR